MYNYSEKEWGLVLAGGGGKGAYQAGVFKAFEQFGIGDYITAVSGASVGALNMVLFDNTNAAISEKVWSEVTPGQFLKIDETMIDLKEGVVSRDGVLNILNDYINMDKLRDSERKLYVAVTEYNENGLGKGIARYFSLNYRSNEEIKNILLASSALPIIYSPIEIDGKLYRDGGIKNNVPIMPLYIEGIRNFIVVTMSPNTSIDYSKYPDAKFLVIKPQKSIGDFIGGTLDFSSQGAKLRMELGYLDAVRELEFFGREDEEAKRQYTISVNNDYLDMEYKTRRTLLKGAIDFEMNKINDLINKYT